MPSPFDKLTESDKMRNFVANRPFTESLAASEKNIFDSEMSRLQLTEQQDVIQKKASDVEAITKFNSEVVSKSTTPEQYLELSKQFLGDPSNSLSAKAIVDYSKGVEPLFTSPTKIAQEKVALERSELGLAEDKRVNEMNAALQEKRKKIALDTATASQLDVEKRIYDSRTQKIKEGKSISDSLEQMQATISFDSLPKDIGEDVEKMSNFYGAQFSKAIETDRPSVVDEAAKVLRPFISFDKSYNILASNWATKNVKSIAKIQKQYSDQYENWRLNFTPSDVIKEPTFENYLLSLNAERSDPSSDGFKASQDPDVAQMLSDRARLGALQAKHKSYIESVKGAFDGEGKDRVYNQSRASVVKVKGLQLEDALAQDIQLFQLNAKTQEDALKQTLLEARVGGQVARTEDIKQALDLKQTSMRLNAEYKKLSSANSELTKQMEIVAKSKTPSEESKDRLTKLQGARDAIMRNIETITSSINTISENNDNSDGEVINPD